MKYMLGYDDLPICMYFTHNIDLDYISNIEVGKNPLKPTRTQKTHQNPTQKPIALKKPRVFTNSDYY